MKKLLTLAIVLSVLVFTLILPAGFTLGQPAYADTKQAALANPSIHAKPTDNRIGMDDFTPNASVTLEIYDAEGGVLIYGPETLFTDDTGSVEWHSRWWGMGEEFFDLTVGYYIVVTDNETGVIKALVPIYHTFDRLDIDADVASGTAPPFSAVHVHLHLHRTGDHHYLGVTANANGDWTADFGAAGMDVLPFMEGIAKIDDDDGDATSDNPPTMHFWWRSQGQVETRSFTPDASVTIEFYDAPGGNRLYGPETHFTNTDGRIEPMLELYAHDVIPVPGNCLVITDDVSMYSKSLTIPDDMVNPVDSVNDLVTGTALPFAPLMAHVDILSEHDQFDLFADESGNWIADFGARGVDLGWDTGAGAWTQDEDHDRTLIPGLPWIMASLTGDWMVFGNITPHGTVTFEIYDSVGGNRVFGPQSYSPEEGEWIITPGINLVPGNYIVATDDLSGRLKDLVLVEASVTLFDREQDLVAGTAPSFSIVEVDTTQLPFQIHHRMRVSTDADGHWVADFGAHGLDITEEEWTAQAKVLDEDYDSTAAQPVPFITVTIDIKPGSDPNSINCNNENGGIPVAILTTEDFDATTVDHTTVAFEGASETHVDDKSGDPRRHEEDVDADGNIHLVFHFRLGDTDLTCNSTEGTLIGETFDGQAIEGTDAVRMIDRGGGKP